MALSLVAATLIPENVAPIHCYALLSPIGNSPTGSSQVLETGCFETFPQAIAAATNGQVKLDPATRPQDVTQELLDAESDLDAPDVQVVIGIDYDYSNYGGSTYTWVANDYGCSSTIQYGVPTMPSGWDNRVSSARGYSNCNYYYHYPNANYSGTPATCHTDCATMGTLDNDASSERWTYTP